MNKQLFELLDKGQRGDATEEDWEKVEELMKLERPHIISEGEKQMLILKSGEKIALPRSPTSIKIGNGRVEGYVKLIIEWDTSPKVEPDPF